MIRQTQKKTDMTAGFWWGNFKERDTLKDLGYAQDGALNVA